MDYIITEHMLQETEEIWQKWTEAAFPDLNTRTYFLPPLYFNHVQSTEQLIAETKLEAKVLKKAHTSTVKDDTAMKHMFKCLEEFSEQNKEVMFVLSNLQFGDYLGEPAYAPAAALLDTPKNLPPPKPSSKQSGNLKEGDFDFLLIHRKYGLVTCEVKSVGGFKSGGTMTRNKKNLIRKRLKKAISQLNKAEGMLSHLVPKKKKDPKDPKDPEAPKVRITKTIAFPNLTTQELLDAIASNDNLEKVNIIVKIL